MDIQSSLLGVILLGMGAGIVALWLRLQKVSGDLQARDLEVFALRRDLAKERENLDKLSEQETKALDAVFDAVLVIDNERRLVVHNQAARELFNIDSTALGKTLMTVTHHHELDALAENALKKEHEDTLDSQITFDERTFKVRCTLIGGSGTNGNSTAVLVLTLQDISELLRLTRARRDMVANFSHDLRTPISSIRLLVDTLSNNFGRNPERDLRLLGKIAGETDSLEHMTQELMDLSMIESGKAISRMIPVQFPDIMRDAVSAMGTQIEQKKLELVINIPADLLVLADPEQTRRVVTNLIHNSIKFTPSGGRITFEATADSHTATIRARDSGIGIPPQERTRVFERFYQVDTARSGKTGGQGSGSGLGLSIAKHIIEAQGGRIWAEGVPSGSGACIVFTIPLADKAQEPHKKD